MPTTASTASGGDWAVSNPCGTGSAHIKPGFERATYVSAAAAEGLIGLFSEGAGALVMAPIIAGGTYDLLHICASDPPDDPLLSETDFVNALNLTDFVNSTLAWNRIKQWFVHMMWPTWCECDNGTKPPTPITNPLPDVNDNPGLPSGPSGQPCFVGNDNSKGQDANGNTIWDFNRLLPNTPVAGLDPAFRRLPSPLPQQIIATLDYHPSTVNPTQMRVVIDYLTPAGGQMASDISPNTSVSQHLSFASTPPAGAGIFTIGYDQVIPGLSGPPYNGQFSASATIFCAGSGPSNPITPCCPPDPTVEGRLNAIVQMLQVLGNQLVTGNAGLVDSTTHIGLSGSGTITLVNSCAAIRVVVTAGLPQFPNNPGSPTYYFSMGFITSIAEGSPLKGWRLVYEKQTYPLVAYADQIGYTLPAGVVVNVTELLASP